jgi:micrococcal nuclease
VRQSAPLLRSLAVVAVIAVGALGAFHLKEPGRLDSMLTSFTGPVADALSASFSICDAGAQTNCVVDGDTFRHQGEKIRITDIDTPELSPPRCAREKQLGEAAKRRLHALLNAGRFSLVADWRDEDRYGRKLRIVTRQGRSIGDILVSEGLARRWDGSRHPWCD